MFDEENVSIDETTLDNFDGYTEEPYVSVGPINTKINLAPTGAKKSNAVEAVPITKESLDESLRQSTKAIQNTMADFEDDELEHSKNVIDGFTDFIQSKDFKEAIRDASKRSGIPPKKLANSFFGKVAGSIGDMLGIAINVVDSGANTLIDLLSAALRGGVSVICKVARFLTRLFTFNKTNKAI